VSPEPERFDLVVVGAGPAGEKAAAQAAYFGKRVAVVDRRPVAGGDAVANAVIPSKTLRETALYLTGFRAREVYGLSLHLDPGMTLERLLARTAEVVKASEEAATRNLERHGVELVPGDGRLGPNRTVRVRAGAGDRVLQGEVILLATGSSPARPRGVPFEDPDVLDSDEVLTLDRIPRSLVVVGGGAVGCEYASIFTAPGGEVTLVDSGERLITFLDAEVSQLLADTFRAIGIRLLSRTRVDALERAGGTLHVRVGDGHDLRPDKVLFTIGRVGSTEGLGLEDVGVEVDRHGLIRVDEHFRTTAEGIYAAGDVIGHPALASVSMEQGRVAVCYAFEIPFKETVDPMPPFGVYSIPEVAMVGLTEEEAAARGIDHEVGRGWFSQNPRAVIAGGTEGLVKLVFRREDRVLVGVHVLGDQATELIHIGQAVLHAEGTIDRFIHTTFNVPSRADAYKYAAYDGLQRLSGRRPGPPER